MIVTVNLNNHRGQGLQVTGIWKLLRLESPCILPSSRSVGRHSLRNRFSWNLCAGCTECSRVSPCPPSPAPNWGRRHRCWWIMCAFATSSSASFPKPLLGAGRLLTPRWEQPGFSSASPDISLLRVTSTGRTISVFAGGSSQMYIEFNTCA